MDWRSVLAFVGYGSVVVAILKAIIDEKAKARNYGNEVTDMVQQYIDNKDKSASNENEKSSGRSK